jgi:hypothetical protein
MEEILSMVAQFLIPAIFAALMVFYGLVFWHWRNDGKKRDVRRENPSRPVANVRTFGS